MKTVDSLVFVGIVLALLCFADAIARRTLSNNEENEEARKKLLEREDKDIELDAE